MLLSADVTVDARRLAGNRFGRRHHSRLVHLSSDLVFSGAGAGGYTETDPVDPVTVYGRTMAEAEATIRAGNPAASVLRISLPMGPSFNRRAGAIDWLDTRFRKGRPEFLKRHPYGVNPRIRTVVHTIALLGRKAREASGWVEDEQGSWGTTSPPQHRFLRGLRHYTTSAKPGKSPSIARDGKELA